MNPLTGLEVIHIGFQKRVYIFKPVGIEPYNNDSSFVEIKFA